MSHWRDDARRIRGDFIATVLGYFSSLKVIIPYFLGLGAHRKVVTEEYPDPVSSRTEVDLPMKTRGILVNEIDLCTGCGSCVEICPARCIRMETEASPDPEKKWVSVFEIDFTRCVLCGLCTEVCEPDSLKHTKKFIPSSTQLKKFTVDYGRGPISPEQREKWQRMKEKDQGLW